MGWTVRAGVAVVACSMTMACAPKRLESGVPANSEPFTLQGTWWLMDSTDGPVRARLVFDNGDMKLFPVGSKSQAPGWNVVKHRGTWEAHGPDGALLWVVPRGDNQLTAWTPDGRLGLGFRLAPLPGGIAGKWLVRDPRWSSIASWTVVPGPENRPGMMLESDGETREVWPFMRAQGEWGLVIRQASGDVQLMHLARGPDETWMTWTEPGNYSVMYRKGERPSWLPVQGVLGTARPTKPPPGGTELDMPNPAKDLDVPESLVRSSLGNMLAQLDGMAPSAERDAVGAMLERALAAPISGKGVYGAFDRLERTFERVARDGLVSEGELVDLTALFDAVAPAAQ